MTFSNIVGSLVLFRNLNLLNVEVTVKEGALFPCKQIWEDVEFAHVLDKLGLKCLKMQRFLIQSVFVGK